MTERADNAAYGRTLVLIGLMLCAQVMLASDRTRTIVPARFLADPDPFEELIEFPEVGDNVAVAILCAARISRRNKIENNTCFSEGNEHAIFEEAIYKAVSRARVSAATVNGKAKEVWFPYSVVFRKTNNVSGVRVIPNYRVTEETGPNYSSPQRILRQTNSVQRFFQHCLRRDAIVWTRTSVSSDGRPYDVQVLNDISERCIRYLTRDLLASEFIPAYRQANPVDGVFFEPYFTLQRSRR